MIFLILLCVATVFGSPLDQLQLKQPSIRIGGGNDADIANYPYQVSVAVDGDQKCGGVIIGKTTILSAASCFEKLKEINVTIRAGSSQRNEGRTIQVKKINTHPKYTQILEYNIAVLELESSLTYGVGIQPIQLPKNSADLDNKIATVTGWGLTSIYDDQSDQLHVINTPVVTRRLCEYYFSQFVPLTTICAGGNGKYACTGDLGGPLVVDGVLQGILCAEMCGLFNGPDLYTNVFDFLDFISKFIRQQ